MTESPPTSPVPTQSTAGSAGVDYVPTVSISIAQRMMATTLGNIATLLICALLYLNYVLFESYIGVFLYAFLASEALWDTKCMLVGWLKRVNDEDNDISLRAELQNWTKAHPIGGWVTWVSVAMYGIGFASYPLFCIYFTVVILIFMGVTYVFDRRVLFLFQVHRWFLDDDTLIALVLIILVFFTGAFLAASFSLLVLRDAKLAVDLIVQSFEGHAYFNDWVQNILEDVSRDGKNALNDYVDVLEEQYLKNSSWGPVLRWSIQYVDNVTSSFEIERNDTYSHWSTMILEDPWSAIPQWPKGKIIEQVKQLVVDLSSSDQDVLEPLSHMSENFKESLVSLAGMGISAAFLVVDFGVRLVFFITILMILLSSKEAALHEFLAGFTETEGHSTMFEIQLRNAIEAVLLMPIKMSLLNAMATLVIFWMFGIKLMFFAASLSLLITVFPVVAPFWICLPWIMVYYMYEHWSLGWSVFVFLVNYLIFYYVNMWVLAGFGNRFPRPVKYDDFDSSSGVFGEETKDDAGSVASDSMASSIWTTKWFGEISEPELLVGKREYITGLSVFFGITAFGAKGALLGPLVVCLGLVMYNVLRDQQQTVYREQQSIVTPMSTVYHSRRHSYTKGKEAVTQDQDYNKSLTDGEGESEEEEPEVKPSPVGQLRRNKSYANHDGLLGQSDFTRSGLKVINDLFNISPARNAVQRPQVQEETSIQAFQKKLSAIKGLKDEDLITEEQFSQIRNSVIDAYLCGQTRRRGRTNSHRHTKTDAPEKQHPVLRRLMRSSTSSEVVK